MDMGQWILWGFAGTVILTTTMAGSQGLRLTRMNVPFLLGTMVTPNRDRALVLGVLLHLMNGWIFSAIYLATFHAVGFATWWFGALIGLVHSLFVLMVGLPIMPAIHPRMASPAQGPTELEPLEPPGFMAKHYGVRTPVSVIFAHLLFGAVLGLFYRMG